jgi:transmembrane sensor
MEDLKNDLENKDFAKLNTEEKILLRTSLYKVPAVASKDEVLKQIKSGNLKSRREIRLKPRKGIRTMYWIGSAAASILVLFGLWQFLGNGETTVATTRGNHSTYTLPDGSTVTMNAQSKIIFDKGQFNSKRLLKMEGEVFFSVQKGKTFTIKTERADIKILGTSFNVFARERNFKVSCVTGKIQVISGSVLVIITPGQSAEIVNNKLVKYADTQIKDITRWRVGDFNYRNKELKVIFKEIERQFNVNFVVPEMEPQYYSGSFTNKSLTETLDKVCIPMGLTYEIGADNKVYIKKKN